MFAQADSETISSWRDKTSVHWGRLLSREKGADSEQGILLTGSGTAANEASMLAARDIVNGGTVYRHPFWYYENEASVSRLFGTSVSKSEDDSDILLVNLEPTNHFTLANPNSETPPLDVIRSFLLKAAVLPDKRIVLVVDATVNPNICISDLSDGELPPNLVLLKTVSATKHQKGGRDYFFGVIGYKATAEVSGLVRAKLSEYSRLVSGVLPNQNVAYFPRPTPAWLAEKRRKTIELNRCLAQIRPFPDSRGWSITPYTFHSFVFPPAFIVNMISEFCAKANGEEAKKTVSRINDFVYEAVVHAVERTATTDIGVGDSFGLPVTRINTQGGESNVNGASFRLKLPRISPGYSSSARDLRLLATELLNQLDSRNSEFLKVG